MNYRIVSKYLGTVAVLIGGCMSLSLPWAMPLFGGDWRYERSGFHGLLMSIVVCLGVGWVLHRFGRRGDTFLFRKEAMAVVGLSWVLATLLGALPYVLSGTMRRTGVPMHYVDAMFEAQSGFSTTGATVLSDLEDREMVARCILFWRSSTHYLGGLGIIVLFVVVLGQGSAGKAMMRAEMPGPSQASQHARMQHTAWILFYIYTGLNGILTILLWAQGVPLFDSLCHAFGTMATGGFSTYNASVGHFTTDPRLPGGLIEMTITVFMVLAGTNFMLMYVAMRKGVRSFFQDPEWRVYVSIILVATLVIFTTGMLKGDFDYYGTGGVPIHGGGDPPEESPHWTISLRYSVFQVVSILTTTGFVTDEFENWNALSVGLLLALMFIGGCAGSTGGGMKVVRHLLCAKILWLELERAFHPRVVRPLRLGDQLADAPEIRQKIPIYFAAIALIFVGSSLFLLAVEPDSTWVLAERGVDHKLLDSGSSVAATLNNIGPGLGLIGARRNYGNFTPVSKLLFIWLMMLGRLEVFVILSFFIPGFWRSH